MIRNRTLLVATLLGIGIGMGTLAGRPAEGAIVNYTNQAAFLAAVGPPTIITFQEFPPSTPLSNQYLAQGVTFADGNDLIISLPVTFADGAGVDATGQIELVFSTPMLFLGADFPGALQIEIFSGATSLGISQQFGSAGIGFFGGITSTVAFDRAIVTDWVDNFAYVDNFYFGDSVVPEPSAAALLGVGALGALAAGRRRRVRGAAA